MSIFNRTTTETAAPETAAANPTPNDLAAGVVQQAAILWQTALGARVAETAARHAWTQAEVIPWREALDQAVSAFTDYVLLHQRNFEDTRRMLDSGHAGLVDLSLMAQARDLYAAMDSLRTNPARPPEGLSIESALRAMRHSGALAPNIAVDQIVELTLDELAPPAPHVGAAVDDMISRVRVALEQLPACVQFATAQGTDFLWNHPTVVARLERAASG